MTGDSAYMRHIRERCRADHIWKLNEASGNAVDYGGAATLLAGTYNATNTRESRLHPLGTKLVRVHEGSVTVADANELSITNSGNGFTCIAWVYVEGSGDADQFPVTKGAAASQEWGISYQNAATTTVPQANIYQAAGTGRAAANGTTSPSAIGRWTMLWGVFLDGVSVTVGMNDGVAYTSTSFSGSYTAGTGGLNIGFSMIAGNGALTGNVGYVSTHSFLISRQDLAQAYRLGIGRAAVAASDMI